MRIDVFPGPSMVVEPGVLNAFLKDIHEKVSKCSHDDVVINDLRKTCMYAQTLWNDLDEVNEVNRELVANICKLMTENDKLRKDRESVGITKQTTEQQGNKPMTIVESIWAKVQNKEEVQ